MTSEDSISFGELSQREIVSLLVPYTTARDEGKRQTEIGSAIKAWLTANPEERRLVDGEAGLEALLQEQRTVAHDVISMPDTLILQLARMGALKLDSSVVKPLAGRHPAADAAKKYEMPGTRTVLVVRSTQ